MCVPRKVLPNPTSPLSKHFKTNGVLTYSWTPPPYHNISQNENNPKSVTVHKRNLRPITFFPVCSSCCCIFFLRGKPWLVVSARIGSRGSAAHGWTKELWRRRRKWWPELGPPNFVFRVWPRFSHWPSTTLAPNGRKTSTPLMGSDVEGRGGILDIKLVGNERIERKT